MGNDGLADGGPCMFPIDPLLPQSLGSQWVYHVTSFIDNLGNIYSPGSLAIQQAFDCTSKFAGALVLWLARGSDTNMNSEMLGDGIGGRSRCPKPFTQVTRISSITTGFFLRPRSRKKPATPFGLGKISSLVFKKFCEEAERLQSLPLLSLAGAIVPSITDMPSTVLAGPLDTSYMMEQRCVDHRPCEIEKRGCGPCAELPFQSLAWTKNTVEPKTGIEFPTVLDNSLSGETNSSFNPAVLVGTGSRTVTFIRIKSLEVYAFGFYIHPFDVCQKLGPKYVTIPEDELNKQQDFYRDLLREDINMTVRLVVSCNGIKINTVKDVFEKALRARLKRANPDADFRCLQTFGSMFAHDIPLHVGTTINFHRTTDGHLVTEVGGTHIGAVHSKDLCRAFFGMYIGDIPVCEQSKEEIGKNVANIIRMC